MSDKSLIFNNKNPYTLGVEEEYMLCDPNNGNLISKAEEIIKSIPITMKDRFSYELILSEIEINTPICSNVNEALKNIIELRKFVKGLGNKLGYKVGISGTHPEAIAKDQKFVKAGNYQWVKNQLGYYARRNITFALHVHVSVPNEKLAIKATNGLRRWIPALLSLSANSPFFEGEITGMKSSRTMQFGSFPRTNIPQTIPSFEHYENLVNKFIELESIQKSRQIWWKIRPHFDYGTIEFRMIDIQRSLKNTVMFIALAQALTHRSIQEARNNKLQEDLSMDLLNDSLWKSMRFGFGAKIVDTGNGDIITLKKLIERMVQYCLPSLKYFNTEYVTDNINNILNEGTEGDMQVKIYNKYGMKKLKQYLMKNVEYEY